MRNQLASRDNTGRHSDQQLTITSFFSGKENGQMLQVTTSDEFVQVDVDTARWLASQLHNWAMARDNGDSE